MVVRPYSLALAARLGGGVMHGLFWGMLGGYVARIGGRSGSVSVDHHLGRRWRGYPVRGAGGHRGGGRHRVARCLRCLAGLGLFVTVVAAVLPIWTAGGLAGPHAVLRTPG